MSESKSAYDLIVFDWDGTIADSLHGIVETMTAAIAHCRLEPRSEQQIRDIIGLGLVEAMQKLFPGMGTSSQNNLINSYREIYYSTTVNTLSLFPSARPCLEALDSAGYLLAVATGKSRRGLDRALKESGLSDFFHFTRCADETFSKPHPQMLEELLNESGIDSEKALMVGDSEYDLQMAMNANIAGAAVTYGAQRQDYLLRFKPVACFSCVAEIPEWLESSITN